MKQSPQLNAAQARMRPGVITLEGFLGPDRRKLIEIIDADHATVRGLGLQHDQIAGRLRFFTERGKAGLGAPVRVDDDYEVEVQEARGFLTCPWGHRGKFRKSITTVRNLKTREAARWSPLCVHLIETHGFYEGVGAAYRKDPAALARVLDIQPAE